MNRGICDDISANQPILDINTDVVFVPEVALIPLLRPAGIDIFLSATVGFILPLLRNVSLLQLLIFCVAVVLFWHGNQRSIDNLPSFGRISLLNEITVKLLKQGLNQPLFSQLLTKQPNRCGIGYFIG